MKYLKIAFIPLMLILVACNSNPPVDSNSSDITTSVSTDSQTVQPHEVFEYNDIFMTSKSVLSTSEFTLLPKHVSNDENVIVTDLGYMIEGESSGASIVYRNIVDLATIEGNVIEFEAYYNDTSNFNSVEVSLIDIYDANNQVKVIYSQNPTANNQSRIAVSVNGKVGAMNNVGSDKSFTNYAVNYRNNFRETINPDFTHSAFSFRYDVSTSKIYSVIDSSLQFMLLDLKDQNILRNSVFAGFKTNEVYVKIEFKQVDINSDAKIAITKLGNRYFNEEITNEASNLIKLEMNPTYYRDALPKGVVNQAYSIPAPIYEDYLLGNVQVIEKLYFGEQDQTNLIVNQSFTPKQTGTYLLEYQALDIYGNEVKRNYHIEILASIVPIQVDFETKTYNVFEESTLPEIQVSGGHGELALDVKHYFNNQLVDPVDAISFPEIGTLKTIVKVNDYLNQNQTFTKEYPIGGKTILSVLDGIPRALYAGSTYKISDFEAIDYSKAKDSAEYYLPKSVYIDGVQIGNDMQYQVPTTKEQIEIVFYGGKGTTKEISQSYIVKIIDVDATLDASGYLMHDQTIQATQADEGVLLTLGSSANPTISLPNGMVAHELGVEFITENPNYSYVEFILTDYYARDKQVKVRYYKSDFSTIVRLQDNLGNFTKSYTINDTFTGNKSLLFYLDNENHYLLDYYYSNIAKIEYYADGSPFKGFENNAVFLDFSFGLARENASFILCRVGNQSFKSGNFIYGDSNAPQIAFLDDLGAASVGINTKYTISSAKAYDVLQSNSSVTLSVVDPTGTTIINNSPIHQPIEITLDQYGIYRLMYTTKDSLNNLKRYQLMVTVIDEIEPTITIDGSYQAEYAVGNTITLQDYTVSDNLDETSMVQSCIFIRDLKTYELHQLSAEDQFQFSHAGDYEIIYYAIDSSKNVAREVVNITVR